MIEYTRDEVALMFLSTLDFATNKMYERVCEVVQPLSKLFDRDFDTTCLKEVFKSNYDLFISQLQTFNANTFLDILSQRNIFCITIFSPKYPEKLNKLQDPPYVLYGIGNIDLLYTDSVAIVGTRNPSTYGKIVTEKFAKILAQHNLTIVSGLASGVDKLAHDGALMVGGNTIAVIAGGFDHIFPAMNVNLARDISQKGLLLSEHFVTHKPTKYAFPIRNRIISALSNCVLITEAGKKSGSLYTSEYALEMGIDTFCVPGNITSERSYATNLLIKKGEASCATTPEDILLYFGINSVLPKKEKKSIQLSMEESIIYDLLRKGEQDFLFLQEKTGFSTQNLNFNLTSLEIRGIIKKLAGNSYILCD